MGCCFSEPSEADMPQPSLEERRRLQAEAADRRREQATNRGIRNPAHVQRRQKKLAAAESLRASGEAQYGSGLRWTVSN